MEAGYELRFKNGDIVYWCQYIQGKCVIHYGMVDTQFSDVVCIDLLVPKDCRTVDGVPIKEWKPDYRTHKLPKNWTYNTILFEYGHTDDFSEISEKYKNLDITDKSQILEAYNEGWLVKSIDNCHCCIEADVGKGTYTLKKDWNKKFGYAEYYSGINIVSVSPPKVYDNYQDAFDEKLKYEAEFQRVQNLTDLEWSIEQIDKILDHWSGLYHIPDNQKKSYRDFIMNLSDLEDVEVRMNAGNIQWKYWKNKRWQNIEISNLNLGGNE